MMSKVLAVVNQKGGVGKTTTCCNLGIGLVRKGKKVLLIDADPQGSLTASLGYQNPDEITNTVKDVMQNIIYDMDVNDSVILHNEEGVDLVPSNIELAAMEISLVNVMCREFVLKQYIDQIKERYDYILIDSGPSLGMLTINVLSCADYVVIPVAAEYLPVNGMQQLLSTIIKVRKQLNTKLQIAGILITMVNKRTKNAREITQLLRSNYEPKIKVFNTIIPESVRAAETPARGMSIYKYDPKGAAKVAYEELVVEVLGQTEEV